MKGHAPDLLAVAAGATSIAAWQEQLEWSLKILATLVAIAAGVASFVYHARRRREERTRAPFAEPDPVRPLRR